MTAQDLQDEFNYRYQERLGLLLDSASAQPTTEQKAIARAEAQKIVDALRDGEFFKK